MGLPRPSQSESWELQEAIDMKGTAMAETQDSESVTDAARWSAG